MSLCEEVRSSNYIKYYNPKNQKLIISGHGLASGPANLFNFAAVESICRNKMSIDFIAMGFHNAEEFLQTSIAKQTSILNNVISHHAKFYNEIYLIGCSYSSLACLQVDFSNITKLVLVVPSLNVRDSWSLDRSKSFKLNGEDLYLNFDSTVPRAYSSDLKDEGLLYGIDKAKDMLDALKVPTLIINAKDDPYYYLSRSLSYNNDLIEEHVIENAGHDLQQLGVMKSVLNKTFRFFK